jgi:rhomboid protease GluP
MDNRRSVIESGRWRVIYNAKFTLTFCLLSLAVLLLNMLTGGLVNNFFGLSSSLNIIEFYQLISYTLCHADFQHFIGNILLLLMLGPILEEKYGTKLLTLMTLFTAFVTGLLNVLLFDSGIIGASGIVFMFIVLSSVVNMKQKEIPLTFIFIVLIYVGGEVINSFNADNISQFAHIIGGIIGGGLGFLFSRKQV